MMTFDDVMVLTRTVSSPAAFSDAECRAYFDLLMSLPEEDARVVEVGLQSGRSSSIVAQVSKEKHFEYLGIDPFVDPPDAAQAWIGLMRKIGVSFTLHCMKTLEAHLRYRITKDWSHLVLIDGDHSAEGVRVDIEVMTRSVIPGGYILFHDYGVGSLPNVYPTVNAYMVRKTMPQFWTELPTVDTLGIWQRR